MPLVKCKSCGVNISVRAESCPKCRNLEPHKLKGIECSVCQAMIPVNHEGVCPECGDPKPKLMDHIGHEDIIRLLESGKKIEAVKLYRKRYRLGLKEAKDAVEAIEAAIPRENKAVDIGSTDQRPARSSKIHNNSWILIELIPGLLFAALIGSMIGYWLGHPIAGGIIGILLMFGIAFIYLSKIQALEKILEYFGKTALSFIMGAFGAFCLGAVGFMIGGSDGAGIGTVIGLIIGLINGFEQ